MRRKAFSIVIGLVFLSFLLNACGLMPVGLKPTPGESAITSSEGGTNKAVVFPPRSNIGLEAITLDAGKYDVGKDESIKPGRYTITGKGSGSVMIYKFGVLYISEILGLPAFGVDSLTVDLDENYRVEITELDSATLTPIETDFKTVLGSGDWVAGLDFLPGPYTVSVGEEESGRIMIYDTAGYVRYSEKIGGILTPNELEIELQLGEILIVSNLGELSLNTRD